MFGLASETERRTLAGRPKSQCENTRGLEEGKLCGRD